ncbi:MAG: hypothetical protein AAFY71_07500 [Bacteroidota bacterium]
MITNRYLPILILLGLALLSLDSFGQKIILQQNAPTSRGETPSDLTPSNQNEWGFIRVFDGPLTYKIEGEEEFKKVYNKAEALLPYLKKHPSSMEHYDRFLKKRKNGNLLVGLGSGLMLGGISYAFVGPQNGVALPVFRGVAIAGLGFLIALPGVNKQGNAIHALQRSVEAYNQGEGYVNHRPDFVTPEWGLVLDGNGLGVGLRF